MITQDKITNIFCTLDEFSKKFDAEAAKGELKQSVSLYLFFSHKSEIKIFFNHILELMRG